MDMATLSTARDMFHEILDIKVLSIPVTHVPVHYDDEKWRTFTCDGPDVSYILWLETSQTHCLLFLPERYADTSPVECRWRAIWSSRRNALSYLLLQTKSRIMPSMSIFLFDCTQQRRSPCPVTSLLTSPQTSARRCTWEDFRILWCDRPLTCCIDGPSGTGV